MNLKAYTKTIDQKKIAGTFDDRHIEYKSEDSEKLSIEQNFQKLNKTFYAFK